jgi:hypothetical protein
MLAVQDEGDFALQKRSWGKLMDMTLRPGDYPLGSVESRAAVRAMIEREHGDDSRPRLRVFVLHPPHDCKGEVCLQPSETEQAICHLADERLCEVDGNTFYDVLMKV